MAEQNQVAFTFQVSDQLTPALQAQGQALQSLAASAALLQQSLTGMLALSQQLTTTQTSQTAAVSQTTHAIAQLVGGQMLMQQSLNGVLGLSQQLAQAQQAQTAVLTQATQAFAATAQAVQQLSQQQQQATQSASSFGAALQIAGGLGIVLSLRGIVTELRAFLVESTHLAIQREALTASFRALTGGTGAARTELAFLRQEATRTSSDFDGLASAYRNLTAASRGTKIEGEATREVFLGITEAGRVLGLSQAQIGRALLAVEQIISKGQVSQEELRRQLGNAIPGAAQIAARAFGVTTEELSKLISAGVSAEEFVRRFGPQLRREFGPGLQEAAQTASATFARLANEIKDISAGIGSDILKLLTPVAKTLDNLLQKTRQARTQEEARAAIRVGGIPVDATDDERAQLLRLGRLAHLNDQNAQARQAALDQGEQIRAGIAFRTGGPSVTGDIAAGGPLPPPSFVRQTDQLKQARQDIEQELALIQAVAKNAPAIFAGSAGELEKQNSLVNAQRQGLEKIAEIVAKSPGLLKQLTPEFLAAFEALNKQYVAQVTLRDAAQATVDAERQAERDREAAARKAEADAKKAEAARDRAIEQLGRLGAQLTGGTKTERAEDVAAAIQAQFPTDAQIQTQADQVIQLARTKEAVDATVLAYQEEFLALKQRTDATREAEATQKALNDAIQKALDLARAPKDERTETRLRAQFAAAGVTPTTDQDAQLRGISDVERRKAQAKQIEDVFRDLGRSVEQTFQQLFETIFSGGVTSAQSFGLLVAQSLQSLFGKLAAQLTTTLLTALAGGSVGGKEGSGIGGLLAGLAAKIIAGAVGGSASGAAGTGDLSSGAGTTFDPGPFGTNGGGTGLFSGLTIGSKALGGIAYRPQFALIGDNPSGHGEAVVPLTGNRAIPVEMRSGSSGPQTIVLQLHQDYRGTIDPRSLKSSPQEIVAVTVKDVTGDGQLRRVILQHATR